MTSRSTSNSSLLRGEKVSDQLAMLSGQHKAAACPGALRKARMTGAILIASGRVPIVQTICIIGSSSFKRALTSGARPSGPSEQAAMPWAGLTS